MAKSHNKVNDSLEPRDDVRSNDGGHGMNQSDADSHNQVLHSDFSRLDTSLTSNKHVRVRAGDHANPRASPTQEVTRLASGFVPGIVIGIIIGVILARWPQQGPKPIELLPGTVPPNNRVLMLSEFTKGMNKLQAEFPSQTDRLWKIITSATLPIIQEDEPVHPAVILLVADQGSSLLATCLAQRYAELVTKVFSAPAYSTFNCQRDTANKQPDEVKRELDNKFTSAFEARSKSGVVLHIENLPGKAAMIFYRFCDNDNAPFKDVSIVLTLTLESAELHSEKDSVAFSELRRVWESGINRDKMEPLFSRIGNSIAFVKPETREALQKASCPLL
jgi:F0F1-type ATP synthase assembly protein I